MRSFLLRKKILFSKKKIKQELVLSDIFHLPLPREEHTFSKGNTCSQNNDAPPITYA